MKRKFNMFIFIIILLIPKQLFARIDAGDFDDLIGYTIKDTTNVEDDFEGADYDEKVFLDNGMVFTFNEYSYSYSYRPDVVILAKQFTYEENSFVMWKLIIDDEIYDVDRVK